MPIRAEIDEEYQHIKRISDLMPPLTEDFKKSCASLPHSGAGFENDEQKTAAQAGVKARLFTLSNERGDIVLGEVETSIALSHSALSRIHLLLARQDELFENTEQDRYLKDLALHKNQSLFHIERANGILPTAFSHLQTAQKDRTDRIVASLQDCVSAYAAAAPDIDRAMSATPGFTARTREEAKDGMARILFADIALDLARLNREIVEKASARIVNALAYVALIDTGLIPYGMGEEKDWLEQKVLLLQESLNSFNTFLNHINGAKGYLAEAETVLQQKRG